MAKNFTREEKHDIFRRIVGGETSVSVAASYEVSTTCAISNMCLVSEMIRDFLPKTLDSVRIMARRPNVTALRENADFWLKSLDKLEQSLTKKGKQK